MSQNSDVYQYATKNKIVDIQLDDGSVLDRNALVVDAIRKGSELYAVWKDIKELEEEEDHYEDFEGRGRENAFNTNTTPEKKKKNHRRKKKNGNR